MTSFPGNIYIVSLIGGFALTFLLMPAWIRASRRLGMTDDPGARKIHLRTTPLAGGIAVGFTLGSSLLAGAILVIAGVWDREQTELIAYGYANRIPQLAAIMVAAFGMLILGALDDRIELSPAVKFSGQFALALLVALSGVRATVFVDNVVFSHLVTVLWILTLVNAFNFLDNMNGLCAGLGAIATLTFAVASGFAGQYLVASMNLVTAGALLGFLPYNFPNARSFLGDSGSHLVGFLVAIGAILTTFYGGEAIQRSPFAVVSPLLIAGVPLFDLASVVIIRWRLGKPFYIGDTNHISHRLVRSGWSRRNAVLLIWAIAAALSLLSFAF